MKKILILLLLFPIHLFAKTCFVIAKEDAVTDLNNLTKCKNGEQLHLITLIGSEDYRKKYLIEQRASFCDVKYNAYIDSTKDISTLTCIFMAHHL